MPKTPNLSPEELYARRRAAQENYRHRVRRFTFQFSLQDAEALEWFDKHPDKGSYLKKLILADKAQHGGIYVEEELGHSPQHPSEHAKKAIIRKQSPTR